MNVFGFFQLGSTGDDEPLPEASKAASPQAGVGFDWVGAGSVGSGSHSTSTDADTPQTAQQPAENPADHPENA